MRNPMLCTTRTDKFSNYKGNCFSWAWWRGLRYGSQYTTSFEKSKDTILQHILTVILKHILPKNTFFWTQDIVSGQFLLLPSRTPTHHPKI